MREPCADRPRSVSAGVPLPGPADGGVPSTRREARELAARARARRTPRHSPAAVAAAGSPAPLTRREARELAARTRNSRRRARARKALPAAATVVSTVTAVAVVALPTSVSAGTPAQSGASLSSALTARAEPAASRGTGPRLTLTQGVGALATGGQEVAARFQTLASSVSAGVETTQGGQARARELGVARAFHEPVLGAAQTSSFGWRWGRMHNGLDFAAAHGTPLYAVGPGTVTTAGWNSGLGYHVKVTLDTGETVVYGHLSHIMVDLAEPVVAGTVLGAVGSTGRSTGAHLHFEVRTSDGPIDPEPWLADRRGAAARG